MRLDKYLKVSRLIKRRTVAKDICEGEKVSINGRVVKPSAEIKTGDVITINMRHHILEVKVISTPATVRAEDAESIYQVLKDEKTD